MKELRDMNEKYQSSERAMMEMEQRFSKRSNLGDLQDDIDNEKELLRHQKEEVAMLKEQLENQLRNASLDSTRTSEMDRRSRREERARVRKKISSGIYLSTFHVLRETTKLFKRNANINSPKNVCFEDFSHAL
jgi:hypothetical protein